MDYAKKTFTLDITKEGGVSLREHLEQIRDQTNKTPPELDIEDEFPEFDYLMSIFNALNDARGFNFGGACPVTYSDIMYYKELLNISLAPWEVEIIKKLDGVFLDVLNAANKKE